MFYEHQRQPDELVMNLIYHLTYLFNKYLLIPDMVDGVSQSKMYLDVITIPLVFSDLDFKLKKINPVFWTSKTICEGQMIQTFKGGVRKLIYDFVASWLISFISTFGGHIFVCDAKCLFQ